MRGDIAQKALRCLPAPSSHGVVDVQDVGRAADAVRDIDHELEAVGTVALVGVCRIRTGSRVRGTQGDRGPAPAAGRPQTAHLPSCQPGANPSGRPEQPPHRLAPGLSRTGHDQQAARADEALNAGSGQGLRWARSGARYSYSVFQCSTGHSPLPRQLWPWVETAAQDNLWRGRRLAPALMMTSVTRTSRPVAMRPHICPISLPGCQGDHAGRESRLRALRAARGLAAPTDRGMGSRAARGAWCFGSPRSSRRPARSQR